MRNRRISALCIKMSSVKSPTQSPEAAMEADIPLSEVAYRRLHQAIVRCEVEPGQRLRVDELSRQYEISSSPLREALSRLAEQGLVQAFENRGFHVSPLTVEGIADLTRVRLLVESEALRDAMANGSDQWESNLVAAAHHLSLIEQRLSTGPMVLEEGWSRRHRAFHMAIYAGATSPLLLRLVAALFDNAERFRHYSARHRKIERNKTAEHQRLLAAVLARDEVKALGLLRHHISSTERNVTESLLHIAGGTIQ